MTMQGAENLRLQRVRTTRVFEEICEQIRRRVASGQLKPGDKLPPERELALEFRVSRPAVREAFRSLEMSGLILLQKGVRGGAFIRRANSEALDQTLNDAVALRQLPRASCIEAVRVIGRATIELACQRIRPAAEGSLPVPQVRSETKSSTPSFIDRVGQIAGFADNELLVVLMQSLANLLGIGPGGAPTLEASAEKMMSAVARGDSAKAVARWDSYLDELFPEAASSGPQVSSKKQRP
jgi:GntR family transcriptional regulator, transcriptional repressor for pyruvate dehydrogenase complex